MDCVGVLVHMIRAPGLAPSNPAAAIRTQAPSVICVLMLFVTTRIALAFFVEIYAARQLFRNDG
jgi:hypothetical protein